MLCLKCGCEESKVVDSRNVVETNAIRRRRECLNCGKRYTTYEKIERIYPEKEKTINKKYVE